jgi:hypothetical protein
LLLGDGGVSRCLLGVLPGDCRVFSGDSSAFFNSSGSVSTQRTGGRLSLDRHDWQKTSSEKDCSNPYRDISLAHRKILLMSDFLYRCASNVPKRGTENQGKELLCSSNLLSDSFHYGEQSIDCTEDEQQEKAADPEARDTRQRRAEPCSARVTSSIFNICTSFPANPTHGSAPYKRNLPTIAGML